MFASKKIKMLQEEVEAIVKTLELLSNNIGSLMDVVEIHAKRITELETLTPRGTK